MKKIKELIRAVANRPVTSELIQDTAERIARIRASPEGREGVAAVAEEPVRYHGADAGLVVPQVDPDGVIPVDVAVPWPVHPAGPVQGAGDCGSDGLGEPAFDVGYQRGHDSPGRGQARAGHLGGGPRAPSSGPGCA